jgi:MFS family permease
MLVQAAGHAVIGLGLAAPLLAGLVGSVLLGVGTAMVYPALLAAVGDVAHPAWRATSVGIYRFWRDLGYGVGALMAGVVAAVWGLVWAVHVAGILTALSGLLAWAQMGETLPGLRLAVERAPLRAIADTPDSRATQTRLP